MISGGDSFGHMQPLEVPQRLATHLPLASPSPPSFLADAASSPRHHLIAAGLPRLLTKALIIDNLKAHPRAVRPTFPRRVRPHGPARRSSPHPPEESFGGSTSAGALWARG